MFGLFNNNKCEKNENMWIWLLLLFILFQESNEEHCEHGLKHHECNECFDSCKDDCDNNGQSWIIWVLIFLVFTSNNNNNIFGF